jgi:hypothetical protein
VLECTQATEDDASDENMRIQFLPLMRVHRGAPAAFAAVMLAMGAPLLADTPPAAAPAAGIQPPGSPAAPGMAPAAKKAVPKAAASPTTKATAAAKTAAAAPTRYLPDRFAGRAGVFYKTVWGVDLLAVKLAESDEIIRFSWRVLDPSRAAQLNNKGAEPSLIDPKAGVSLVVPVMENVGMLRQTATPEAGKSYWMAFSNKGRIVKRGDRVTVVIGQFRAEGLMVD